MSHSDAADGPSTTDCTIGGSSVVVPVAIPLVVDIFADNSGEPNKFGCFPSKLSVERTFSPAPRNGAFRTDIRS